MIKICFVCHGNICRSPMAEYVLKNKLKENNISNVLVDSRATSFEEAGSDIYYYTKLTLEDNNIPYKKHKATKLVPSDIDKYDYIYCMEDVNVKNAKKILGESDKIEKLLDFDIEDPWFTGNFTKVYTLIDNGCDRIIEKIKTNI